MNKLKEFGKLTSDIEKWKYLINSKNCGLIVMLDNDSTFVVDENNKYNGEYVNFSHYIGWSDGVMELLSSLGINFETV